MKSVRVSASQSPAQKSPANKTDAKPPTTNPAEFTDAPIHPPPIKHGLKLIDADMSVCYITSGNPVWNEVSITIEQYLECLETHYYLKNLANIKFIRDFFNQMKAQFPEANLGAMAKLWALRFLATVSVMTNQF